MKNILATTCFVLIVLTGTLAQETSLKERALGAFKLEHYDEAISLLEKAEKETPDDPEIFYYMGWFNHYRAYDSRPLRGYDFSYSEKIFAYFDRALELKPDYGDAKYFYGAECSGNAFVAMQNHDANLLRHFYQRASAKGAYPEWLIEFGKNFMIACDSNAIVFTGGNADFDICSCLQLCHNFRTDLTLIPIGNIDRPWYVQFLKEGLPGAIRGIHLSLTPEQIVDIHPFKWDTTRITIDPGAEIRQQYHLPADYQMIWTVAPDLTSERMHSKMAGEKPRKRTYMSPQRAILIQIVEDNLATRPIFFSNFASPTFYGGLEQNFQDCGLVSKLLPFVTTGTKHATHFTAMQRIVNPENLQQYKTLLLHDIPRISGIASDGYAAIFKTLATHYRNTNQTKALENLLHCFNNRMKIGLDAEKENRIGQELKTP